MEIYFLELVSNVHEILAVLIALSVIAIIIPGILLSIEYENYTVFKIAIPMLILSIILKVIIPSTETLAKIYGVETSQTEYSETGD